MTAADREQLTQLMQSSYDSAVNAAAADRKLDPKAVAAVFEASPQFTEDAKKAGLIDKVGYDDDALKAALNQAGGGAQNVPALQYVRVKLAASRFGKGPHVALVEASGDIVEGSAGGGLFGGSSVIASDDMARAIRDATNDKDIKAIILRVDLPGGSVTASDQILDAVKKAQAAGKPVVVSMGGVAASGGYYIATSADEIVAEPGTITGSIGVLTGKVSVGKSLGLIGVGTDEVGVGKNALMNSDIVPYTPDQLASLNAQADAIYADFTQKVASGRKLPLAKVQEIARGRVWTGADANARGLVDQLGGFWTAVDQVKKLSGIPATERVTFERYPRHKSFFDAMDQFLGGSSDDVRAVENFSTLMNAPGVREAVTAVKSRHAPPSNFGRRICRNRPLLFPPRLRLTTIGVDGFDHRGHQTAFVLAELRAPNVENQHHAQFVAAVPGLVFNRVVKIAKLFALGPFAGLVADAKPHFSGTINGR